MGIAQALVESATGTSRFAREANNLLENGLGVRKV